MKDIFPSITENEWLLMKVVWEKGTCTASGVSFTTIPM